MGLLGDDDEAPPGAIQSLLASMTAPPIQQTPGGGGLLGPGGPMPAAMSTGLPSAPPAPSMIDRIHDRLSRMLDATRPSAPAGYGGLLSPDEIASAQPGRFSSFYDSDPKAKFAANLNNIIQMKQLAAQVGEHSRVMQARQAMPTLFPQQANETDDQTRQRLAGMYSYAMAHGDEETMKDVGSTLRGIMTAPKVNPNQIVAPGATMVGPDGKPLFTNGASKQFEPKPYTLNGQSIWVNPGDPVPAGAKPLTQAVAEIKMPETPAQLVTGKDGKTYAYDPKARTMQEVKTPDGSTFQGAPKTTGTQNAQQLAADALLRSSASEMTKSDAQMKEYEKGLSDGSVSINGLSQFLGGLGNAFTHDDPASRAIQNTALTTLNTVNPDLARYIRRGLSFAEGEAGISKRPSDFRTKMATFLSTAASGATPGMISDIQSRRSSILDPINSVLKGSGSASGSSPTHPLLSKYGQQIQMKP